jgi:hypothetical protein
MILPAVDLESLAPLVRDLARRLAQGEALGRVLPIDARLVAAEQGIVVGFEVVAEQG